MKTIILGKEGNQPFPIKKEFGYVSRRHAQITIDDCGDWYLEDLGSSNGTFIRDEETGERIEVTGKQIISPVTFIFLGPDNSKGCCFYAKQVEAYGDFTQEHEYMGAKENEFDHKLERIEQNAKLLNIIRTSLPVIALGISTSFGGNDLRTWMIRMAATGIVIALMLIIDPSRGKKSIKNLQDRFHHCPNPTCSHKMTSKEIHDMRCAKCKK